MFAIDNNISLKNERAKLLFLWTAFFAYASAMALIFQSVVVPNIFIDSIGKLLPNDAVYFDEKAWELAQAINANGWKEWRVFVANSATGNTGILAGLYAVFGHDVSVIVPINAGLHALGGILIFTITKAIATNKTVGLYAGLISASLFVMFPSALSWYGQVHKDSYAIAGTLLMLFIWIKLIKAPLSYKGWVLCLFGTGFSLLLIGMVRPYGLTLLLAVSAGASLIIIVSLFRRHAIAIALRQSVFVGSILGLMIVGVNFVSTNADKIEKKLEPSAKALVDTKTFKEWEWETSGWLPTKIENYIAGAASTRFTIIKHDHKHGAGSTVDEDIAPQNIKEVASYLPRALQVATFAPFPTMWLESDSIIKLLSVAEMLVFYICIFGLIFLLKYNRKPEVLITLYFAVAFLTILGFTMANLGTLYRVSYAYFFIMLMLGVLGWMTFLMEKSVLGKVTSQFKVDKNSNQNESIADEISDLYKGRKQVLFSSIYVMILTLIGFIGFFYRDILMAQVFGLNVELDSFFVAILIPMTVVTILCIPLGAALTPIFLKAINKVSKVSAQNIIATVSAGTLIGLFLICLSIYFLFPTLLPYIVNENLTQANQTQIEFFATLSLSLLLFSGPVIIGNAVLNALGRAALTTTIQLVVPVAAIFSVVIYGEQIGVKAVILGMVSGQILNLLILEIWIKKQGYSLWPNFKAWSYFPSKEIKRQYLPLVASAFFVSVSLLVSTLLAMSLPNGGVSTLNLGNKVVILITGILGAAISAVLLPYFSMLITQNNWSKAKQELSGILLLLTGLSIPFSAIFFAYTDEIIGVIFLGLAEEEIRGIANVMRYAVVQIPFFACNILLLKYATATDQVIKVLSTAIMGLLLNIGLSLFLMGKMGIEGIVLGASLSLVISTIILIILLSLNKQIKAQNVVLLLLSWLLFAVLLINIHIESYAGIIAIILAYTLLILSYYILQKKRSSEIEQKAIGRTY
jgi:peptidoglycan biosynthesis protein MviN/MurJ (putative lipid II flippase)